MILNLIFITPVLIRAVYTDIRTGKIENRMLIISAISGLVLNYYTGGARLVLMGVKMAVVMTGVLFVLFILRGLGAGDIKLLSVVGLYLPEQVVRITVAAFIIAGLLSVMRILLRAVKKEQMLVYGETIHFSVPILLSVCMTACIAAGPSWI